MNHIVSNANQKIALIRKVSKQFPHLCADIISTSLSGFKLHPHLPLKLGQCAYHNPFSIYSIYFT